MSHTFVKTLSMLFVVMMVLAMMVGPARTCEPNGAECSSDMSTNCCSKYCLWFPGENTGTCQDRPGENQGEYQEEYQDD